MDASGTPAVTVRVPSDVTLAKYGFGFGPYALADTPAKDWLALVKRQRGACAICKVVPPSGRLVTDHEHVPGYSKLPPGERRKYVRGLLDVHCNFRIVPRGATPLKLANGAAYLRRYDRRRPRPDKLRGS